MKAKPPMRRVLILSASAGAGHLRAAEALEVAARDAFPDLYVENHDVLALTNAVFRRLYAKTYLDLVNTAPHLLGMLYDWLDRPVENDFGERLRRRVQKLNLRKFEKLVCDGNWDLVISTHFLPVELISQLRTEGKLSVPQVTVCTDFATHRLWVNQPCERYFGATAEGAEYLEFFGVPARTIEVTGIPIHPEFSRPYDVEALRRKHHLSAQRPVVLQMCGGFGVGPVARIFESLLSVETPLDVIAIAGRNEELRRQLESLAHSDRHQVQVLGFTTEMPELMTLADLLVTKPGGLTTSEALACGLPLVVANPIPGQETRNSDYLLENGAAVKIDHPSQLALKVSRLLADRHRFAAMKANAKSLGKPRAAFEVLERSLEIL
jgi:processive 1,2-diacylglycerol beta-glucosyltransferase